MVSTKFCVFQVEQTVNDISVSSLSETMRGCIFKDDVPLISGWPFNRYTYSGCLLYCRALAQYNSCNCTHHFMANIGTYPVTNVGKVYRYDREMKVENLGILNFIMV